MVLAQRRGVLRRHQRARIERSLHIGLDRIGMAVIVAGANEANDGDAREREDDGDIDRARKRNARKALQNFVQAVIMAVRRKPVDFACRHRMAELKARQWLHRKSRPNRKPKRCEMTGSQLRTTARMINAAALGRRACRTFLVRRC